VDTKIADSEKKTSATVDAKLKATQDTIDKDVTSKVTKAADDDKSLQVHVACLDADLKYNPTKNECCKAFEDWNVKEKKCELVQLGLTQATPAPSCMTMKDLKSGIYWLKSADTVYQTYCDNDNNDGGWSYASTFTANQNARSDWNYYSNHWTNPGTTLRPKLLAPYSNDNSNVKTHAFNGVKFNEVRITNSDGSKYIVLNNLNKGSNKIFNNLIEIFKGCYRERNEKSMCWMWGSRKAGKGGGMWSYPQWSFNNVELVSDQCWNGRISVCRQTSVYHTGGGTLIGVGCSGENGGNKYNLMKSTGYGSLYQCTGSESHNLAYDRNVNTFHMFVRSI